MPTTRLWTTWVGGFRRAYREDVRQRKRITMGIRRLPSGCYQVRFQLDRVSYAATFPTREIAEDAEPWLRESAPHRPSPSHRAQPDE